MPHWTDEISHPQLTTPEAKQALSKYNSFEDALVGGLNAIRKIGDPFRLPDSLDKLPSDEVRGEFTSKVNKLFGGVQSEQDLSDLNFNEHLPEGHQADEPFVKAFKKFAVSKKMTKGMIKDLIAFNNQFVQSEEFLDHVKARQELAQTRASQETNKILKEKLGTDEAIKTGSENIKRMFLKAYDMNKDAFGMKPEDFESIADGLIQSGITQNAPMALAMMKIAENYTEGQTGLPGVKVGQPNEQKQFKDQMPATSAALGW